MPEEYSMSMTVNQGLSMDVGIFVTLATYVSDCFAQVIIALLHEILGNISKKIFEHYSFGKRRQQLERHGLVEASDV